MLQLAYIDPGSGSILLQVLLATCLGGIAICWGKIKSWLGIKPKSNDEDSTDDSSKPES